jgi:predicted transcriptional regulator of viral defense system
MIAELALKQHGVVALSQLRTLGVTDRAMHKRVRSGRMHRVHHGVYAVGHAALAPDGRRLAAVLACGRSAVLSHRSAATMWDLVGGDGSKWHVTAPGRSGGRQGPREVVVHHPRSLHPADVTTLRAIPITTVARTLVDLADVLGQQRLERAVHEAEVLRLLDVDAVHRALQRAPGRRGRRTLLTVLAAHTASAPTRSELEARFSQLRRDHDLPRPRTNVHLDIGEPVPAEVDALFDDTNVIVELDGAATHHTARAFERDRARDAALAARGYVVVRLTWRRMQAEPRAIAAELRRTFHARTTAGGAGAAAPVTPSARG